MQFPIALYKDKDNQIFHVIIPDIPHLTTQGEDMAAAIYNARRTVSDYLYDLVQKDNLLPEPSPISDYVSRVEFAGYIWAIVSIELSRLIGETAELSIRLPVRIVSDLHQLYPNKDINQIILDALKIHLDT